MDPSSSLLVKIIFVIEFPLTIKEDYDLCARQHLGSFNGFTIFLNLLYIKM